MLREPKPSTTGPMFTIEDQKIPLGPLRPHLGDVIDDLLQPQAKGTRPPP